MRLVQADSTDAHVVIELVLAMLHEMASYLGRPVAGDDEATNWLADQIALAMSDPDHLLLLVKSSDPESKPIGLVQASIRKPEPVFQPERILHVHAIYVKPGHRRQGIAERLIEAVLVWGRERACVRVRLNVLESNPARHLYNRMGFEILKLEMHRPL